MFGVREREVLPVDQVGIRWGTRRFTGGGFAERFDVIDTSARVVAAYDDGQGAAYERKHGRGAALILGTFAGERNQVTPLPMHPLGDLLLDWAGVSRAPLQATSFVEARRMESPRGALLFLFNHGTLPADAQYEWQLAAPAASVRELIAGHPAAGTSGATVSIEATIPPASVRVFRADFPGVTQSASSRQTPSRARRAW
jgi:hypothetical protein